MMTSVSGHLTSTLFGTAYKDWNSPPPQALFSAPVIVGVDEVCATPPCYAIVEC